MNKYEIERAWQEIRIGDLVSVANAMLESEIDVFATSLENGAKAKVTIRFTQNADYLDNPDKYFRMLRSWTTLLEKVVPGKRFSAAHRRHDEAEFEANVIYRIPMKGAKYVGRDGKSYMKSMALFEVGFILSQALRGMSYWVQLEKKFPDPRHKWETAIRSRIPLLDNAARIYVPERPRYVPPQNRDYFD